MKALKKGLLTLTLAAATAAAVPMQAQASSNPLLGELRMSFDLKIDK